MVDFESMDALSFSFVDVLVVVVVLISAAFAAYRGFVQESLSILAWAAAAFASLYFGPVLAPLLQGRMAGWAATLVSYAAIFLVIVIPLSFVSYRFAEGVRRSPVHTLDRSLGFAFGIARGLAIVAIVYLVFSVIVPIPRQPRWMTQARLLPLIQSSADVLLALLPDQDVYAAQRQYRVKTAQPAPNRVQRDVASDAETSRARKTSKETYGASERRALDRLIETTASSSGQKR